MRLINWVHGLPIVGMEPLTGPRAVRSSSTESVTGFPQSVSSPFGMHRWMFAIGPIRGPMYRSYRGLVTALHGGANAVLISFPRFDQLTLAEAGIDATQQEALSGTPWSNGAPWSNGENWSVGRPLVPVAVDGAKGASVVHIANEFWGYSLKRGDVFGFVPLHLAWYTVTEVQTPGSYRIWPPLRKAITVEDWATLRPTMAMKLEGESGGTASRGRVLAEGNSLTMVEVEDATVRAYVTD